MTDFDLSVIVTAHNETIVCGPAMRSAEAACAMAEAAGFRIERLIALDSATEHCSEFFHQPAFDNWERVELACKEVGITRNTMSARAKGKLIAFLDADDLFSENWLVEGIRCVQQAEREGLKVIAHPEFNWLFDGGKSVFVKPGQDDPLFTPYYFNIANYYDALSIAPREVHEEILCVTRDIPNGLSFQDWQWGLETMAAGWLHVSVRDTIIFKRRRDSSLVTESNGRQSLVRAIEPLAIDKIANLHKAARKLSK